MKHTINTSDFTRDTLKHLLASSCGKGSNKQLYVVVNMSEEARKEPNYLQVSYQIKDGETKVETSRLDKAVNLYNELP